MESKHQVFERIGNGYGLGQGMSAHKSVEAKFDQSIIFGSVGQSRSITILEEGRYIPSESVYPTGKKDGNRLGKRKRQLEKYVTLLDVHENKLYVHPSQMDKIVKSFTDKKHHKSLEVILFDSSSFWEPIQLPPIEVKDPHDNFGSFGWLGYHGSILNPIPMIATVTA